MDELDDEIGDGEWPDAHDAPENACDGSDLSTLRMPIAPAASAITTARSGNCQKALDGTVTGSGNLRCEEDLDDRRQCHRTRARS